MEISVEYIQEIAMHMYHNLLAIANADSNRFLEQFPINEFGNIEIDDTLYPDFEGKIMRGLDENDNYSLVLEIKRDDRVWLQSIKL